MVTGKLYLLLIKDFVIGILYISHHEEKTVSDYKHKASLTEAIPLVFQLLK
jgi:hypothetical protein